MSPRSPETSTDTAPPAASRRVSSAFEIDWTLPSIRRHDRAAGGAGAGATGGVTVGGDAEPGAGAPGSGTAAVGGGAAGDGAAKAEVPGPMTRVAIAEVRAPSTPTTEIRSPTLIAPRDCAAERSAM